MPIDQGPDTQSLEEPPKDVRARRAAVLAGIGLIWAAFMASIGLVAPALAILAVGTLGAAWIGGVRLHMRMPRLDLDRLRTGTNAVATAAAGVSRTAGRRTATVTKTFGGAATRRAASFSRQLVTTSRKGSSTARRRLATAGRASAARMSTTAASTKAALHGQGARVAERQRSRRRRSDPRVEEALASNSQGIALAKAGKPAEAIDAFDTALSLLAEAGDRHHEGQVLVNLGVVHRSVGGAEAARFCWSKALERLEPGTRERERTAELLGVR